MSEPMPHLLTAVPLTRESIAPFGDFLSSEGLEPIPLVRDRELGYGGTIDGFRGPLLESDEPVEFLMPRFRVRDFRLLFLERHPEFTQAYVPVTGAPYVWVLARPDAPLENGVPVVDELRAFVHPGDAGIRLHRGTWHEAPMPFRDGLRFVVLSQIALTDGVVGEVDARGEVHKLPWVERLSVPARTGRDVRVALP